MDQSTGARFAPAVRTRLADHVVAVLLDAIVDGRLVAGSLLPPERELAD